MNHRCSGNGLMVAGLIVTIVGLAVSLTAALEIPRHWTTVLIGVALFLIGAMRRAIGGHGQAPRSGTQ